MITLLTNLPSLMAQRSLESIQLELGKSFRRLASGRRVVTAADDPVAMARATRLEAATRSLNMEIRGLNDEISYYQIGEGTASEVQDLVVRMRELAVQSANDTMSDRDRDTLMEEFGSLREEVDRLVGSAQFAFGLDGLDTVSLGIDTLDIGATGDAETAMDALDSAHDAVAGIRGANGATMNLLGYRIDALRVQAVNLEDQHSRLVDADMAEETARLVQLQIRQQAALAVLGQANTQPEILLQLLAPFR